MLLRLSSAENAVNLRRSSGSVAVTNLPCESVSSGALIAGRFVHEIRSPGLCVTLPLFLEWADMWHVAQVGACE